MTDKELLELAANCVILKKKEDTAIAFRCPEGWQLVPKEPTEEMCYEGQEDEDCTITNGASYARALYKAMLAAAPEYKP